MRHEEINNPGWYVLCYILAGTCAVAGLMFVACPHTPHCMGSAAPGWYIWSVVPPLTFFGLKFQGTI